MADLVPIVDAYYAAGHYPEIDTYETAPLSKDLARVIGSDPNGVLFLSPANRAPSTLVDGPFLETGNKKIPIGLLPMQNKESLERFAKSMMDVNSRKKEVLSMALLSQKHPRFIHLVDRMHASVHREIESFRWTSHDLVREDMIKGLGLGLGLSIYFGHGRPTGWVGYYGLRAHHFDGYNTDPVGAMLNLCCLSASRRKVGYSFAEKLVMQGVTTASFGAVKPTLHTDNTRWAVGLVKALEQGAKSLDELLVKGMPIKESASKYYRIIGDPMASVLSSREIADLAQEVVC